MEKICVFKTHVHEEDDGGASAALGQGVLGQESIHQGLWGEALCAMAKPQVICIACMRPLLDEGV